MTNGKAYTHLTSLSLTKAVLAKEEYEYSVTVIIDAKQTEKTINAVKLF